jgi:anthocyanidin reductase
MLKIVEHARVSDPTIVQLYDMMCRGAVYVFHAASPVLVASDDPEKEVIGPAVAGTLNVLASCAKSRDTVKRVVITG